MWALALAADLLQFAVQRSICAELVRRLQRHSAAYTRATAFAAELDCLLALASAAKDFGLARPLLTPEDVLYIKQGEVLCCMTAQLLSCKGEVFMLPTCSMPDA